MTARTFTVLPWHPAAHDLIKSARAGQDSLLLVGAPGTGKTELVEFHLSGRYTECFGSDGVADGARSMLYVMLGRAVEPSTLLVAILEAMHQPTSARLRRKGATVLMQNVANWLAKENVGALVLDEVQHASPGALFHAMLLIDVCQRSYGHALGLILIGTPDAAYVVRQTGQMGQRVPIEFPVPLLSPDEISAACHASSEEVARLLRSLGARRTDALLRDVVARSGGSIRRLMQITQRAVRLAVQDGGRLTEQHVQLALDVQGDCA